MYPIFGASDNESSDRPLSMHSCSSATAKTVMFNNVLGRHVLSTDSYSNQKWRRMNNNCDMVNTFDDSSIETVTSASLYSLHNYRPKNDQSFTDYLFCQATFNDLMEEVLGTWKDASFAVSQVLHAFVISHNDIGSITEQIQLAEKDINLYLVKALRENGISS